MTVESPESGDDLLLLSPMLLAKRVRLMYVTYSEMIQFGLLICAIIGLCLRHKKK